VNLQCDMDQPYQSMPTSCTSRKLRWARRAAGQEDRHDLGVLAELRQAFVVPQGIITLMTRFGMDVTLAHPEGYDLLPETIDIAKRHAQTSGATFKTTHSMEEAFTGDDIVLSKSWAPFRIMEERTQLLRSGDAKKLEALEKDCLANNAKFKAGSATSA